MKTTAAGLLVGAAGVGTYTWFIEPYWYEVVRLDLPIHRLPVALEGKALVQISDLHIGPEVLDAPPATAISGRVAIDRTFL